MDYYKVPQPLQTPGSDRLAEIMQSLLEKGKGFSSLTLDSVSPYLGWEKFNQKHKIGSLNIAKEELTSSEAWLLVTTLRRLSGNESPIHDTEGEVFWWGKHVAHEKLLHEFDMNLGGNMASGTASLSKRSRERFLRQSLIEEAIASSQLEGAATTRERAKKMFVENRKPTSKDEWMIFNNYQTIKKIEEEAANYSLSRDVLLSLHETMVENTFSKEDRDKIGRWRNDNDDIVVRLQKNNELYISHVPPKEKQLQKELDKLIAFANDEDLPGQPEFLHPIVKAIMLHFWFAYLHPFCDGNGRLSRSLFYWYLLRQGYWLISYVPISTVIKKSPTQYSDAFVFSEQYNNDLTYFLDYNLRKIEQAFRMFDEHIEHVKKKALEIDKLLPDQDLNNRQKQVIHHLLGKPDGKVTVTQHGNFHEVGWITANKDLKDLHTRGYLESSRKGREIYYQASPKLQGFLKE